MPSTKKLLQAAAGSAGGGSLYVEDVFSTDVYEGNGSTQAIDNGLDLAGEGGLVWLKARDQTFVHDLTDTERGIGKVIITSDPSPELAYTDVASFNSNGFTAAYYTGWVNQNGSPQVSWSFRKAEKFFDIQTWTGNSTAGRTIAHNLGSAPAFVLVKRTNTSNNWICWHSALTNTQYIQINSSSQAFSDGGIFWNSTTPDASNLTLGNDSGVNGSGSTYVAYLFASDAGGFGDDDENIIKCGSYVGNGGSALNSINLGFEPQWVIVKNISATGNWQMLDVMRGFSVAASGSGPFGGSPIYANLNNAEGSGTRTLNPTATGFGFSSGTSAFNNNGNTFIYIAIRRPMKTPEAGTEVFAPISLGTTTEPGFVSGFVTDFTLHNTVDETGSTQISSRLTGNRYSLSDTAGTGGTISAVQWDFMDGSRVGNGTANSDEIQWMFKRARGFMDVVVETATQTLANPATEHNLGVVPEFMISKSQNSTSGWFVYHSALGLTKYLEFSSSNAYQTYNVFGTTLTSTQFQYYSQAVGESIVNYLFATVAGVSKVGSYTGTGSDLNVDCGFSAGARWVMIKRSDISDGVSNAGDWYLWDSLRGIIAGNDPYLLTNTTAAQVTNTDYIDPLSSGFTVTSSAPNSLNKSGGTYIFLAIA